MSERNHFEMRKHFVGEKFQYPIRDPIGFKACVSPANNFQ